MLSTGLLDCCRLPPSDGVLRLEGDLTEALPDALAVDMVLVVEAMLLLLSVGVPRRHNPNNNDGRTCYWET